MSEVTYGRCELDEGPIEVVQSGDMLDITGQIIGATYAEVSVRVAQLHGMVNNPDEDVFPCTFAALPELDGFYACEGASTSTVDGTLAGFVASYSLTLRRVSDFGQPKAEIQYVGTLRTNAHSITSGGFLARRNDLEAWDTGGQSFAAIDRTSDDGVTFSWFVVDNAEAGTVSFEPVASEHYEGTAAVEVLAADAEWYAIHNRQIGKVAPSSVRLTNHLCRFSISDAGVMTHAIYDPVAEAWESASFALSGSPFASSFVDYDICTAPTVLRNDIDAVVIRYNMRPTTNYATYGSIFVTVMLRAGDMAASLHMTAADPAMDFVVVSSPAVAATSITGGLRRTSNDSNGNRWVIGTPHTFSADTTNGTLRVNHGTTTSPTFMIGQALNGSSANLNNAETALIEQFMLSVYAKTRIVAR